jgi:hypothetical protein
VRETCNGLDDDCNGLIDDGVVTGTLRFVDADADGHGDALRTARACPDAPGFADVGDDCDDSDGEVFPGAAERCNDLDDDCDRDIDEDAVDAVQWYEDGDEDGAGGLPEGGPSCERPRERPGVTLVTVGNDCDDSAPTVNPNAVERCDEVDNDCDGAVDETGPEGPLRYVDLDADGFGTTRETGCLIRGYSLIGGDCDDRDARVHPGALESCSGRDVDCDGEVCDPGAPVIDLGASSLVSAPGIENERLAYSMVGLDPRTTGFSLAATSAPRGPLYVGTTGGVVQVGPVGGLWRAPLTGTRLVGAALGSPGSLTLYRLTPPPAGPTQVLLPLLTPAVRTGMLASLGDLDGDGGGEFAWAGSFFPQRPSGSNVMIFTERASSSAPVVLLTELTGWLPEHVRLTAAGGPLLAGGATAVVVASPGTDELWLWPSTAFTSSSTPLALAAFDGASAYQGVRFGQSITVADVTGDRVADLVVGAPDAPGASPYEGKVRVYAGPLDPTTLDLDAPDAVLSAGLRAGRFGEVVAAGDWNGDGIGDLAVAAPAASVTETGSGGVWLFEGPVRGELGRDAAVSVATRAEPGARCGAAMSFSPGSPSRLWIACPDVTPGTLTNSGIIHAIEGR